MADKLETENLVLRRSIEHLHGPEGIPYGESELVVVCIVRDGRPYVRSFVEHYFSLGVKHIAFLDNNSTDDTVDILAEYDNVTVLRTKLPYKANGETTGNGWTREVLFKQYMVDRFGKQNRWCLCADIDELFDYPYSDVIGLDSLLDYLNSKSYTAVAAQMLDMFPEKPLSGGGGDFDEPLKESHTFCDFSNLRRGRDLAKHADERNNILDNDEIQSFRGGIRNTVFGTLPYLTKFPLVFSDNEVRPMDGSSHHVGNARIADLTCVLYHYKFVDKHFHYQVAQAVEEEHRFLNSAIYKTYSEVLGKNPSLQMKQETSREINGVADLLDNQFLVVSDDYVDWVNAAEENNVLGTSEAESRWLAEALLRSRRQERDKVLRVQRLESTLRDRDREISKLQRGRRKRSNGKERERLQRARQQNRELQRQLESIRTSRAWRLMEALRRLRMRIPVPGRR